MATCAKCGSPLPAEARFCAQCGAPVATSTTEERKVVTVLFADLAASTELAATLDPERFREVMAAFYNAITTELSSLRGRAEKFAGDAVMAVFGLPHAHDDDAVRAVHAAIRIRERIANLSKHLGLPVELAVRIGVNTGPVAAGSGPADQFLVSGAPVNMAARLQQAAEPGEILSGDTTHMLSSHAVVYGAPRTIRAKGFDDAVRAWPAELSTGRASTRRTLPMVGRRRELALLLDAFERARETGRAHLITVLGEAGIGKSRLIEAFVEALPQEARVMSGRATEFEEDPTFSALAEMIRRELGVKRESPREEVSKLLLDMVAGCCDPTEAEKTAARLGLAVGLGENTEGNPYEVAEVRSGLLSLLEGQTRIGPVAMIFEDLEIARLGFLDLIEQLVVRAKRLPLLIVCVARDALLEMRPTWGGGIPDAMTMRLEPLAEGDGTDLARAAGPDLREEDFDRIARHAGGNPFFIVETAVMLASERHDHTHDVPHGTLLPPTVQAVVAARLDHLPAKPRDLVRKASVFPRAVVNELELGLIATVDEETLRLLEDEDVLLRDDKRAGVWRFRHETLRDVAYESLPKRERMRLHLAVADGLPDPERYPSVVAYHLEQAARASLDLTPGDRRPAHRAVDALQHAADIQRRRIQSRDAIELYERGLDLAGPESGWDVREARMLSGIGEARYWRGEYDEAEGVFQRALALAGADAWVRAHANRFIGDIELNVHGNLSRAEWTFDEALAAARELGDAWAISRTLLAAAWAPYARGGDLDPSRRMLEEALQTARAGDPRDRWAEARALTFLAIVTIHERSAADVLELALQSLEVGRDLDDAFTVAVAQQTVANATRRLGRLDEAWSLADESTRAFADLGAPWERASAQGDRGNISRLLGRFDEAETDLREALSTCRELKERTLAAWTSSELARVLIARGEFAEAQSLLRHPSTLFAVTEVGSRVSLANSAGLVAIETGDIQTARERFAEALAMERERGWPNQTAAQVWAVASLCGEDAAGGPAAVKEARDRLEQMQWRLVVDRPRDALA